MNPAPESPRFTRRAALKTLGAGAAFAALGGKLLPADAAAPQPFTLPPLGFAFNALEPHIDARTMEIHHGKHHQGYVNNANAALKDHPDLQKLTGEQLLADLDKVPEKIRVAVRNNVGGHVNHAFFWKLISPDQGMSIQQLPVNIAETFGSMDDFKKQFADAAMKRFGSGWAWLVVDKDGKLAVTSTPNQDSPISKGQRPVIGLDVWEHAYYLHYQNRRADYVAAFWNVLNWTQAEANFHAAKQT